MFQLRPVWEFGFRVKGPEFGDFGFRVLGFLGFRVWGFKVADDRFQGSWFQVLGFRARSHERPPRSLK